MEECISVLTLCMLAIFHAFTGSRLLIFFKSIFFEKLFQEYNKCVKQFGSRSGSKLLDDTWSQKIQEQFFTEMFLWCIPVCMLFFILVIDFV